jgi:hypothetical protein
MQTLSEADFNLALLFWNYHPEPFINLKQAAGLQDIMVVVGGRQNASPTLFAENLFASASEGGQGYSEHPDVYGWQTDDEPFFRAAVDVNPPDGSCDEAPLQAEQTRLRALYDRLTDTTDQVIFHVEGAPRYFPDIRDCNLSTPWESFVQIGDAANHDNYYGSNIGPSIDNIASSVAQQTDAVAEAKPSWFTTKAYTLGACYQTSFDGYPSASRNRAHVYTAMVHGATGIWYFRWDSAGNRSRLLPSASCDNDPDTPAPTPATSCPGAAVAGVRPDIPPTYGGIYCELGVSPTVEAQGESLWAGIASVNHELETIEPHLLSPTSKQSYRAYVTNPSAQVRSILKKGTDGYYYLIAVNMNTQSTSVRFDFTASVLEATVLFENRTLPTGSLSLADTLGSISTADPAAGAVHVYKLRLSLPDSDGDTIADVDDNCPTAANANQTDLDGDFAGIPCDPDDANPDYDGDGCADGEELGPNPELGGRRDPTNHWDFYDTNGDKLIDLFYDTFAVAGAYGLTPADPGYSQALDRSAPPPGGDVWDMGPPDGLIDLFIDIFGVSYQFGHSCQGLP